ncbi:reverse transcriptase [Gossypium australe]|uniref:Reverse transcriptase n=1 Tax=Gossypium australe TaxID=47621 RepID=A0A5B6WZQ7_9ROSI|nr:reverse transcriptase [Gossypium australe]
MEIKLALNMEVDREEICWEQRGQTNWLKEIQPCIPNALNEELSTNFKEEELVEALKSMAPLKASEIDEVNKTNIVLIPKVVSRKNIGQFRPISLCNVLYKILSKAIVNRFRKALNYCIKETRGDFVPDIQITDNILIACELLHSVKKKRCGKESFALKLDMSKAYDRVDGIS